MLACCRIVSECHWYCQRESPLWVLACRIRSKYCWCYQRESPLWVLACRMASDEYQSSQLPFLSPCPSERGSESGSR